MYTSQTLASFLKPDLVSLGRILSDVCRGALGGLNGDFFGRLRRSEGFPSSLLPSLDPSFPSFLTRFPSFPLPPPRCPNPLNPHKNQHWVRTLQATEVAVLSPAGRLGFNWTHGFRRLGDDDDEGMSIDTNSTFFNANRLVVPVHLIEIRKY